MNNTILRNEKKRLRKKKQERKPRPLVRQPSNISDVSSLNTPRDPKTGEKDSRKSIYSKTEKKILKELSQEYTDELQDLREVKRRWKKVRQEKQKAKSKAQQDQKE